MNTLKIDVKINDKVIKTINLDADVLLQEIDKPQYTESEQTDIDRVKAISMTGWISIKSLLAYNPQISIVAKHMVWINQFMLSYVAKAYLV